MEGFSLSEFDDVEWQSIRRWRLPQRWGATSEGGRIENRSFCQLANLKLLRKWIKLFTNQKIKRWRRKKKRSLWMFLKKASIVQQKFLTGLESEWQNKIHKSRPSTTPVAMDADTYKVEFQETFLNKLEVRDNCIREDFIICWGNNRICFLTKDKKQGILKFFCNQTSVENLQSYWDETNLFKPLFNPFLNLGRFLRNNVIGWFDKWIGSRRTGNFGVAGRHVLRHKVSVNKNFVKICTCWKLNLLYKSKKTRIRFRDGTNLARFRAAAAATSGTNMGRSARRWLIATGGGGH